MDEWIEKLVRHTADKTMEAIVLNACVTLDLIEKKCGKSKADELQGYVLDAAMGAAQRLAEVFLAENPGMPRPPEWEPVAKLAADRIDERLASDYLPELKAMLGISEDSN